MDNAVRIALIRQRYTPFGGAERFVENALNTLQRESDIEFTLITRKWDGADNPNIKKIICNPFYIGRLWRDWSFARCACRTVQQNNFDLVQSHERVPCGDIYRAGDGVHRQWLHRRALVNPRWRTLWTKLSPYHRYLLWQEYRTFSHPKIHTIITNSRLIRDEIKHWFPKARTEIRVIHNSVDSEKFNPRLREKYRDKMRKQLSISDTTPLLLFVGSGFERKGVPLLLQTLPKLNNVHLAIIGKDNNIKQYQQQTKELTISHRVHFIGPQQDVRPWYGAADAFAFPTLYDPLPNTVLEAMACGLPVAVSDRCGAVDLVTDGKQGVILNSLDTSSWADALTRILNPTKRIKMGEEARKTAEALTPESMSTKLISLYQRIISES